MGENNKTTMTIDHFEKDWVREFMHRIVGSFRGQMLARTGKIQHNMENERNPGELIGIIEDKCVPGATLPRAEPEEWSCSDGFFAVAQKSRERRSSFNGK